MPNINFPLSSETTKILLFVSLTLLISIIIDNILRSFIRLPKSFDSRRAHTYVSVSRKIITIIVYATAFYIIINKIIGYDLTPLLASAGVIGIVVGIGARALIEDLINGLFLLTQNLISIGDYVKLDDAEGNIEQIGLRTITIRGDSGELYIIPNGQVKKLINFSRHKAYMNIDIPVKSDQDIDLAINAMQEAIKELQKDKDLASSLFPGLKIEGIEEFKIDGKMILRAKIITRSELRANIARKYRYLVKKNFEKYRVTLG